MQKATSLALSLAFALSACAGEETQTPTGEAAVSEVKTPVDKEGWIQTQSRVYDAPSDSGNLVGSLSPPSSVGVTDDGSRWLKLIHGPVRSEATNEYVSTADFESGLYIDRFAFTTESPGSWNRP